AQSKLEVEDRGMARIDADLRICGAGVFWRITDCQAALSGNFTLLSAIRVNPRNPRFLNESGLA
ncbi:MAG TPA: hypothetical protein VEO95_09605, partial [Chthoniobacteraceae bacterium]|nr:hypothetical protein [Chthoniobacteraceae bacterium]